MDTGQSTAVPRRSPPIVSHQALDLDQVAEHPDLQTVLTWWRGFGGLPARRDLTPFVVPPAMLPRVIVIDVQTDPFRAVITLAGTTIYDEWGMEATGKELRDVFSPTDYERVRADLLACVDARTPNFIERRYVGVNQRRVTFRRLMLPLSEDGQRVSGVFTVSCRV